MRRNHELNTVTGVVVRLCNFQFWYVLAAIVISQYFFMQAHR